MSDLNLGKLIEGEAFRDAIHVAIAPVTAAEKIAPGQDIGFVEAGNTENVAPRIGSAAIGIADPWLKQMVYPGQRLWLFLYPQTITSLRHEWLHPAFVVPVKPTPEPQPIEASSDDDDEYKCNC